MELRPVCLLPLILLAACAAEVPEPEPVPAPSDAGAPLAFIEPDPSDDDLDSAVAPYVLARGAGPSRLSPDGDTVVTQLSLTGTRQLYAMDARASDPKATLEQLTQGSGVTFFEFSPDGSLVYGADNNGDERENYWRIVRDADGWMAPELILPATGNGFRVFGGFSGDGRTLVFSSTEAGGDDFDIYVLDMESGEARMIHEGEGGLYVQAVSPSGRTAILSEAVGEDADRLYVLDMESGTKRLLSDPSPRANHTDAGIEYLDENRILLATNANREFAALRSFQVGGGFQLSADVEQGTDADVDGLKRCGNRTVATVNRDGFSSLHVQPGGRVTRLPRGVYTFDCTADDLLVRVSAPDRPGDLFMLDFARAQPRLIYASEYGELDPEELVMPESLRITAHDGVEVQGLLYLPPMPPTIDIDPKPSPPLPPVVFMVHGGPTAQARPA